MEELETACGEYYFNGLWRTNALFIYENGGNSVKSSGTIRTLKGFATKDYAALTGGYAETWPPIYTAYWAANGYTAAEAKVWADTFITKDYSAISKDSGTYQLIKKGANGQAVWMYVLHMLEYAIGACYAGDIYGNDCAPGGTAGWCGNAPHSWDEGWAFYAGSQVAATAWDSSRSSTTGGADGTLIWELAENRGEECGTQYSTGPATVNVNLLAKFIMGRDLIIAGKCAEAESLVEPIRAQMTVPLIQAMLKYAWRADPWNVDDCSADAGKSALTTSDDCLKAWAEGWAFAAAVLPQVHQCDVPAATTIKDNLDIAAAAPMKDGFAAVKTAIESVYDCLGISCTDVGAYQSSGVVYAGRDACTFTPSYDERSGGTVPWGTGAADSADSDDKKSNNSLVVILCAVGGAVLVVGLVILAIIMLRKPAKRSPAPPVHEPTALAPIKAETHEMMEAPPPMVPIPKEPEAPYGYEGEGAFAAEEEEVAPAEAVLAAELPPPAQSWAPELEQELEPEC